MIDINIPNNFIQERKYIIEILFEEFLGIHYKIYIKKIKEYEIILENNNILQIKDSFFIKFRNKNEYLNKINIPDKVKFLKNEFLMEKNIAVIYGDDELEVSENKIICGIDIFSSSFFMLTRWEELVNEKRDKHQRFPGNINVAYNNNFLNRPVVNEYVQLLWNMLKKLGIKQERKKNNFNLILTHDVDNLFKFSNWKNILRRLGGDIIKRKDIKKFSNTVKQYLNVKRGLEKDPFDSFDYLIEKSNLLGLKSRFYFMSGGNSIFDNNYKINDAKYIMKKIENNNHIIGFHASYNSYNNLELWQKEREQLEQICKHKIVEGRQHYLRFEVPYTWRIWDKNNMKVDSTCGYPDVEGFRCGTGDEFYVFDVLKRKKLRLKERPLIIMESTLNGENYRNLSKEEAMKIIKYYFNVTKKYNSTITLLWHNSSFDENSCWYGWELVYEEIIKMSAYLNN